jgi:hypothetical protein
MSNYNFPDITFDGIIASREFVLTKEARDKDLVEGVPFISTESLYPRLVEWASNNCPANFAIWSFAVTPPTYCSDGVSRNLVEYLNYLCSTGNHLDLITKLQTRFKDTTLSLSYENNTININISK